MNLPRLSGEGQDLANFNASFALHHGPNHAGLDDENEKCLADKVCARAVAVTTRRPMTTYQR